MDVCSTVSGSVNRGRTVVMLLLATLTLLVSGCDVDSFWDPSEVGRYENTPVVLPILERLDVIDEPVEQIPGLTQIRSEDLIPEVREYVMGPGDLITVTVFELITPGVETVQTRRIDELGYIRLPVIGQVRAGGLTTKQLEEKLVDILDPDILRNPTVTVIVQEGRQRTFNILGVASAGTYTIVQSNFRLLDAIALARGLPPDTETLYVIRQVPLIAEVEEGFSQPGLPEEPEGPGAAQPDAEAPAGEGDVLDPGALIENLSRGLEPEGAAPAEQPEAQPNDQPQEQPAAPLNEALEGGPQQEGRFINVNGEWVWVASQDQGRNAGSGTGAAADRGVAPLEEGTLPPPEQLVTQRVIEVDAAALMRGDATQNIVIRPGDVIRVPAPVVGNVYIGGSGIARPGTYALPGENELTLKQLVISAGGLSPVAIPERVDLIRRLGGQQEAYLRLNFRAIAEGVQPDIFLRPNDTVTVGTNLFASHLAVIRNGFRFSYGFGFLLDRNFGSDVLGVSPADQARR